MPAAVDVPRPLGLVAELTHRCPLHCPYCSNPLELTRYSDELSTTEWCKTFDEARELGVLQLHLSGGEPLIRSDLVDLVRHARRLQMYTNLVTSSIGLSERRLADLVDAGLDHVQLSIQDADRSGSDALAGKRSYDRKLEVAASVKQHGLPLTVNVVLHRRNADNVEAIADLAAKVGADRLELAHTQYYGWGYLNRDGLMPSRDQVERSRQGAQEAIEKYGDRMQIVYVLPDLYERYPKPCMYGWGSRHIIVTPDGIALPCTGAAQLPAMASERVTERSLEEIWYSSEMFNRFRGNAWMPEPCRSCARKDIDFGGCRCQAFQLLGDETATDPVCELSQRHDVVDALVEAAQHDRQPDLVPRPAH